MRHRVLLLPGPPASTLEGTQKGVCADETNGGVCLVSVSLVSFSITLAVVVFTIILVVIVFLCYGRPECRLDGIEEIEHAFLGTLSLSCTVVFIATIQKNFIKILSYVVFFNGLSIRRLCSLVRSALINNQFMQ